MNNTPADKNRRVLVIDDNRAIHDDFRKILSPAPATATAFDAVETAVLGSATETVPETRFEIDPAYQGQEGVLLVKKALEAGRPYAMAFVDVRMPPGMDGVETARMIWELDPNLQIVLCTAYSDLSWDEIFSKLGHRDGLLILKKPFDAVEAFQLAHALTEKWWLHEQSRQKMEELESRVAERTSELQQSNHALQAEVVEHTRAEEELRWKTAFLEAQVDSAIDGILVVDEQGKKLLQNQRMIDLWKIPRHIADEKDDVAQMQYVTSRAKNPDEFAGKIAYLNSHPDEVSRDEIDLIDGTVLDRYSSPVRDKAGKYYGRIWTFRDNTQHRTLEAQFRQAQKMEGIGQLAAGVAHDFNNILAVIQMQAGLLKTGPALSPQQQESANEIEKAAGRADSLTRQLLLFSRKQTMQPRELDLNQSINDMTKMLRRTIGDDIQVQFKFAMQPLLIHGDASMMDQVLMNLAVNAHDAMPEGGQLVIETSAVELDESVRAQSPLARPGSFVCLSVSDTGCGIPPEILPRIFEPFYTTKDAGKGTGLGLATVFGIVQQHQGWINVCSEVGCGTVFRIYLPRLAAKSGQESGQSALAAVPGGKETILLVEDEGALRSSMRKALSQLGYRMHESVNGVEALKVWEQHRNEIDLLVTDMVMPGGMTGKDLAERFSKENPKLKVIYTSGYSVNFVGRDFPLEEGVNFLAKPFGAHKLAQIVRKKLDARSAPPA
jgi:signal transduction histidine kinase/FixJ family two-component response regulator